jgi:hypothetical protein
LIPLLEKVKGEHHDCCHLLPCTFLTSSGIQPYTWIANLIRLKTKQGLTTGPAISDDKGRVLTSSTIDQGMHEVLEDLFILQRDLFPLPINSRDDIVGNYHAFRSFRRSSDTRTLNQGVSRNDIDLVSRWHQIEKS